MGFAQRTHGCGELRVSHASESAVLNGWVHRVRDLGGVCFVDLRDRTGLMQLVLDPERFPNLDAVRSEACLAVAGVVRERSPETKNPRMATGDVELVVHKLEVLSPSKALPFPLSDEQQMAQVNEELRIKYRYLDLRRPTMYRKLALRASAVRRIRNYLDERGFLEVETPILTRSTPEGARDYLVPYRLDPGHFYALPQSPQQYKQLLMVAGVERYYQIAKCFRDEAQRADRQPEFTQLDLEMSFVTQEDVLRIIEGLTTTVVQGLIEEFDLDKRLVTPFPRLSYDEAMERFGCDKPDLRFGLELFEVTTAVAKSEFGVFQTAVAAGGRVRGVRYPTGASLSRKEVGELEAFCKEFGAKGLATMAVLDTPAEGAVPCGPGSFVRGSFLKFLSPDEITAILEAAHAEPGDLLCLVADQPAAGNNVLYRLRNEIGNRLGLRDPRTLHFCFVLDFPLVEWDEEMQSWSPTHHPFTGPKAADIEFLESDPGRVRADCYDIVCNGTEWASGSIRISHPEVQAQVFRLLGINEETQRDRFGHILEAFQFGAPPHGGIAPGIDRLVMFLTDDENIREVMAFPKIGPGLDPMMGAPSAIEPRQWEELGLRLAPKAGGADSPGGD